MMRTLQLDDVEAAVTGGAILAAGGGGWVSHGLLLGELAVKLGSPQLASLDDLDDEAVIITVSFVGAPAAPEAHVEPLHYIRAVELFQERTGIEVGGLVSSENGSSSTVNGWLQAAVLGIPVVDAPCNGRAHPTGKMGSLGLDPSFETAQAAVGGRPDTGRYVETVVTGTMEHVPGIVRAAAGAAGGAVAVARNPVPAKLLRERAAVGGIDYALRLGHEVLDALATSNAATAVERMTAFLRGDIALRGVIEDVERETRGGFDKGLVTVRAADGRVAQLHTYNEYLAVDVNGERVATFPDLIDLIETETAQPMAFGDLRAGAEVAVLTAHRDGIPLGAGVWQRSFYEEIEQALHIPLIEPVFGP